MEDNNKTIGEVIRETRFHKNETQEQMAKKINVSQTELSLTEKEQREPTKNFMIGFFKEYNINLMLYSSAKNKEKIDVKDKNKTDKLVKNTVNDSSKNPILEPKKVR